MINLENKVINADSLEHLKTLEDNIKYWIENKTDKTVEIIQLYYDCN